MVVLDRVEVLNSGTLPSSLKVEDFKKTHTSHPSNTLLSSVMYYANYIQEAGSGTMEMVRQCKKAGLPEPEFVSVRNLEFKTILPRNIYTAEALNKLGLNERQLKAIKYVQERGSIGNKVYQDMVGISKRQATNDLNDLEKKKVLERIGKTGRGTYYSLRGIKGAKGALKGQINRIEFMGQRAINNFRKRFGDRIEVVYPDKPLPSDERRFQSKKIFDAYVALLRGILGREPTEKEISGEKDISRVIKKRGKD